MQFKAGISVHCNNKYNHLSDYFYTLYFMEPKNEVPTQYYVFFLCVTFTNNIGLEHEQLLVAIPFHAQN